MDGRGSDVGGSAPAGGGAPQAARDHLLAWFGSHPDEAFFLSELEAALGRGGIPPAAVRASLSALEGEGRVTVARYRWDDPHLPLDDFVLATWNGGPDDAERSARLEAAWGRWLREFLASHRCT